MRQRCQKSKRYDISFLRKTKKQKNACSQNEQLPKGVG
ncbi:hypothetical protein Ssal_phage00018 [Streptococcus phage YMC-2011]|nr:hypothetical protein Ssal_phage00018 [Streptococcus phage YMC-2011]AEJ54384.1 hypothetical protein Ssal_phage00018 [Streptococcus phage YMC-2011]